MMAKRLKTGLVRRWGLAVTLMLVGSAAAMAFGILPGSWKVVDGGKVVLKRTPGMPYAFINNKGPDSITIFVNGAFETSSGTILGGKKAWVVLPKGAKKAKIKDGNVGNAMGAKGTLYWVQKLNANGQIIDTKPKQ